jgi:hypothetical protein
MNIARHPTIWWLIDKIFPTIRPLSSAEEEEVAKRRADEFSDCSARAMAVPADADGYDLRQLAADCHSMLDDEQKRQQSIDARLTTIIGLSSIAGTLVFGTLLTTIPRTLSTLSSFLLVSLAYLILQLVCAMLAAVRGLERRAYAFVSSAQLLPAVGEIKDAYYRRQIGQSVEVLVQNQDQNNLKLTYLAVAHTALKNFILGVVIFAGLAGAYRLREPPSDELVTRLKADRVLRNLLRGPEGPRGATGAQGATGPAGAERPATVISRPVVSSTAPK